jgi:hypothetical protein
MRHFERRRPRSTWTNALPEVQGGRKAPSGHAAPACTTFTGWNTLRLGARRARLRPGCDVTFEFGGHLAELLGDPREGFPLALIGREARDKLAVLGVGEELLKLGF